MLRARLWLLVACASLIVSGAHAQADLAPLPSILRTVNDEVGVLSDEQGIRLTRRLVDILEQTGVRIVVVITGSVGAEPIEDYADRLAPRWARERRVDPERMIIVVVAVRDRYMVARPGRALRLATQLDTAEIAGQVGPLFGRGNYYEGLLLLADRILGVIEKHPPPKPAGG